MPFSLLLFAVRAGYFLLNIRHAVAMSRNDRDFTESTVTLSSSLTIG